MAHCAFVEISCFLPQVVLSDFGDPQTTISGLGPMWPYRMHKIQKDGVKTGCPSIWQVC